MDDLLKCLFIAIVGLILIWWIGMGIGWMKEYNATQRVKCYEETHDGFYCNAEW